MAAAAVWVIGAPPPAGAVVTVTRTGSTVTAVVTGSTTGSIRLSCVAGLVQVLGVSATPSTTCGAVTAAVLDGDDTPHVFAPPFPPSAFAALTSTTIDAGSSSDRIELSTQAEAVDARGGADTIISPWGGGDDTVLMGGQDSDRVEVTGTSGGDGGILSTPSPAATTTRLASGGWRATFTGADFVDIDTAGGNDVITAAGMSAASTLNRVILDGGTGDDTLLCGAVRCTLNGGPGANTLTGGSASDSIASTSPGDTVRGNASVDGISDLGEAAFGGRTYDPSGNGGSRDSWLASFAGDAYVRARAAGADGAVVFGALARAGRQDHDAGIGSLTYLVHQATLASDRVVVDLTPLPAHSQQVTGTTGTALDVVVPSGSWTVGSGTITFTGGYEPISYSAGVVPVVRAPFTSGNESFAHRVIRDLLMRHPTPSERSTLRGQLDAGTTTRAQAVLGLTDTDGYRGLAVDRAFVDILRRTTDAAGRAYWIGRLDDDLVLRRLRANLYGSDEYFVDAGNTVRLYVAAAYRDILGRTASSGEIDYWAAQIDDVGLSRGTVADRFLNTTESRTVVIRDLFLRWVLREPTSGELATWTPQMGSSTVEGEVALIRFLAGSATYFSRPDA
ncbi:MAG TPA: DUF4214 domain-containing protein [Iamia sp.]